MVPTVALGLVGLLAGLAGAAARAVTHSLLLGLLVAALAVQVGRHTTPLRGVPLLLVAATSATGSVVLPLGDGGVAGTATGNRHPPVVMLILDELPLVSLLDAAGGVDAARFPHFAELAAASTWYRNATGVSGWTPYALPAMLTGRYPAEPFAPHYSHYPDNLFTAFGGLYDIRAEESITRLCPPSRCEQPVTPEQGVGVLVRETAGLLRQLTAPHDSRIDPEDSYRERTAEEAGIDAAEPVPTDPKFRWDSLNVNQPARFTSFLNGLTPSARPTLHFLHLLMPHSPWAFLPSGARYEAPEDFPNEGDGWVDLARARHLAQLGYTDRLIGETMRTLRASGLWDEALVVVTADHGVSFTKGVQGRGEDAIRAAADEVAWVPLFVKTPGQRGGRSTTATGNTSTCCRRSPRRPPSGCPGGSTVGPPCRRPAPTRARSSTTGRRNRCRSAAVPVAPPPAPRTGCSGLRPPAAPGSAGLGAFRAVDPDEGVLPGMIWGTSATRSPTAPNWRWPSTVRSRRWCRWSPRIRAADASRPCSPTTVSSGPRQPARSLPGRPRRSVASAVDLLTGRTARPVRAVSVPITSPGCTLRVPFVAFRPRRPGFPALRSGIG